MKPLNIVQRFKWGAKFSYQILSFPPVHFIGREPFLPSNAAHKKALLALGVFEDLGDTLRYCAPFKVTCQDGTKVYVDSEGVLECRLDDLCDHSKAIISSEMVSLGEVIEAGRVYGE